MERFSDDDLRELLEALHDKYNRPEFIPDDPISVPYRYTGRADREIAGFLSATIAWGNRKAIVSSGHRMMRFMDDAPADFVRRFERYTPDYYLPLSDHSPVFADVTL